MSIQTKTVRLLSDASGDVNVKIDGQGVLYGIIIRPDSGGTQPTTLFDVTINFEGIQVYQDTALSNTVNTFAAPNTAGTGGAFEKYPIAGELEVIGANMGNAKGADVLILISQD